MKQRLELIVEHLPTPDAEERLARVFDLLLKPMSDSEQDENPVKSDPTYEHPKHPTKSTKRAPIRKRVDRT